MTTTSQAIAVPSPPTIAKIGQSMPRTADVPARLVDELLVPPANAERDHRRVRDGEREHRAERVHRAEEVGLARAAA